MARMHALDNAAVTPEIRAIFRVYEKERGNVPNAFRTLARLPAVFQSLIAHYRTVMFEGEVPSDLKELLFVRVSQRNRARY